MAIRCCWPGLGARHQPGGLPEATPYDPVEDFTQIAVVGGGPIVLVVPAQSPFRTAQDLLEAVKAAPGRYTWATSGGGRASAT